MNKLIEKSYMLSIIAISLLIGWSGFGFFVVIISGLGTGLSKTISAVFLVISVFLFVFALFSTVLALIHAFKQSRVGLTILYGFLLLLVMFIAFAFVVPI